MTETLVIDGRNALVSNQGARSADPQTFVAFRDLATDIKRRILKRPGIGAVKGATAGSAIIAMHEFVHNNAGTKEYWLFRATASAIQYWNGATWTPMALPAAWSAGAIPWFENADNRCFCVNGKDEMIVFDGTSWKNAGCEGPVSAMGYSLGGIYGLGGSYGGLTTVNCTQGSYVITGVGGTAWLTFPEGPTGAGMIIEINGNRYTISTTDTNAQITLREQFKEATAVGLPYQIFYGPLSWEGPLKGAYAYYNPTTGHCSNIRSSAIATENITEVAELKQTGRKLTWTNIVYSPDAYARGFTRIKLFRTPSSSNILVALTTDIANSNAPGSTTFTETASTVVDTALTKFPAQRTKLRVPPTGLSAIKYHAGRMWGIKDDRLYYSLHEAEVVGELGHPLESWPSNYTKAIDQTRGLVVLGAKGGSDSLVVQTANGDWAVEGFDQRDIYVYPLGTRETGSYAYAAVGGRRALTAFYADKQLLVFPDAEDIGDEIQDKLSAVRDALLPFARLHRFTSQTYDLLLLSVAKDAGSSANDVTYVRDLKLGGWYEWNKGFSAFATAHDSSTGALQLWGSDSSGNSFQLLQAATWQDAGGNFAPTFTTAVIQPFDEYFAEIEEIIAYVNDASGSWLGEVRIHEQPAGGGAAFTLIAARHSEQTAQGKRLTWKPSDSVRRRSTTFQFSFTMPNDNAERYFEKIILRFRQADRIPDAGASK
jgi:hypothetical protein